MKVLIRNRNAGFTRGNIQVIKDNFLIFRNSFPEQYQNVARMRLLVEEEDIWASKNKLLTRKEL